MIALKIEDMKQFTASLFLGEVFDSFLLKEAEIVTFNMFTIDGRVRHGYYSEEELEEHQIEEYSAWSAVKPFCFSLIKGKKLPESFHIVLQLSPKSTKSFLDKNQIPVAAEQVQGLYLNIRYEETKIQCVTGTSLSFFTLDKTMDQEWDKAVCQFFKVHKIPVFADVSVHEGCNGLAGLRTCGAGLGNMTETENGLLALKFNEC